MKNSNQISYEFWAADQKSKGKLLPSEMTPGATSSGYESSSYSTLHSAAIFAVSRRGSLGGSKLVVDGTGTIYVGVDREAQQAITKSNQEIGFGTSAPEAPIETRPYSKFLASRDSTEESVFADDPRIAVVIGDHGYLDRQADGHDPWVRLVPVAEAEAVAEAVAA